MMQNKMKKLFRSKSSAKKQANAEADANGQLPRPEEAQDDAVSLPSRRSVEYTRRSNEYLRPSADFRMPRPSEEFFRPRNGTDGPAFTPMPRFSEEYARGPPRPSEEYVRAAIPRFPVEEPYARVHASARSSEEYVRPFRGPPSSEFGRLQAELRSPQHDEYNSPYNRSTLQPVLQPRLSEDQGMRERRFRSSGGSGNQGVHLRPSISLERVAERADETMDERFSDANYKDALATLAKRAKKKVEWHMEACKYNGRCASIIQWVILIGVAAVELLSMLGLALGGAVASCVMVLNLVLCSIMVVNAVWQKVVKPSVQAKLHELSAARYQTVYEQIRTEIGRQPPEDEDVVGRRTKVLRNVQGILGKL